MHTARHSTKDPSVRRRASVAGFSLVDGVIATAIVALGFTGIYAACSQCLAILREARDLNGAQQLVQARVEQLRTFTWPQLTNPLYLRSNCLAAPSSASLLSGRATEVLTVNAAPSAVTPAIRVQRTAVGTTSTVSTNAAVAAADMAQVQVTLNWNSPRGKRPRTLSTTILISRP
jgi:Tfp pilus assembly protein PilV